MSKGASWIAVLAVLSAATAAAQNKNSPQLWILKPVVRASPPGRDHNPKGYTVWLAGGGIKGGAIHGATDDFGYKAVEHPHYYSDLHATIFHQLGLDYKKMNFEALGRTMHLVQEGDGPISQILS